MKKTVCILFTVLFLSSISAYGQNATALSGRYNLSSMELDGFELDEEMIALMGINFADCYIEFFDNGKCLLRMEDDIDEGMYKVDGRTLTIIESDGTTNTAAIDGNSISIFIDYVKLIYVKK